MRLVEKCSADYRDFYLSIRAVNKAGWHAEHVYLCYINIFQSGVEWDAINRAVSMCPKLLSR